MPGAPGKSKGCNTCRKRKKGCDQKRPACGQCIRANLVCLGYERQRTFVNASRQSESRALAVTRVSPLQAVSTAHVAILPHGLARSAYEVKYFGLFWDMYLPRGQALGEYYLQHSVGSWTNIARELDGTDDALHEALTAMSLTSLGHRHGERHLKEEGLKHYIAALSEVKAGLNDPARRMSDALLIASRALGLYEMLYGHDKRHQEALSQADSWQGHNLGEMALIALRTPESQIEGPSHQLFCDGRLGIIIASINLKKRCFLADPVWKTVPWTKIPKTPKDIILDIMADLPALLEDMETIQTLPSGMEKAVLYQRLIGECWRLDTELTRWHDTLSPREHFEALRSRGYKSPSADDQAVASIMCNFWACCVIVYANLRGLLSAAPLLGLSVGFLPDRTDPMKYCSAIGDVLGVFLEPSAGRVGLHLAPFPAGRAAGYLLATGQIFTPTMDKFTVFFAREDGGKQVAHFLRSMLESGYGKWPEELEHEIETKSLVLRSLGGRDEPVSSSESSPDVKIESSQN